MVIKSTDLPSHRTHIHVPLTAEQFEKLKELKKNESIEEASSGPDSEAQD
jgi:hypothetical protein